MMTGKQAPSYSEGVLAFLNHNKTARPPSMMLPGVEDEQPNNGVKEKLRMLVSAFPSASLKLPLQQLTPQITDPLESYVQALAHPELNGEVLENKRSIAVYWLPTVVLAEGVMMHTSWASSTLSTTTIPHILSMASLVSSVKTLTALCITPQGLFYRPFDFSNNAKMDAEGEGTGDKLKRESVGSVATHGGYSESSFSLLKMFKLQDKSFYGGQPKSLQHLIRTTCELLEILPLFITERDLDNIFLQFSPGSSINLSKEQGSWLSGLKPELFELVKLIHEQTQIDFHVSLMEAFMSLIGLSSNEANILSKRKLKQTEAQSQVSKDVFRRIDSSIHSLLTKVKPSSNLVFFINLIISLGELFLSKGVIMKFIRDFHVVKKGRNNKTETDLHNSFNTLVNSISRFFTELRRIEISGSTVSESVYSTSSVATILGILLHVVEPTLSLFSTLSSIDPGKFENYELQIAKVILFWLFSLQEDVLDNTLLSEGRFVYENALRVLQKLVSASKSWIDDGGGKALGVDKMREFVKASSKDSKLNMIVALSSIDSDVLDKEYIYLLPYLTKENLPQQQLDLLKKRVQLETNRVISKKSFPKSSEYIEYHLWVNVVLLVEATRNERIRNEIDPNKMEIIFPFTTLAEFEPICAFLCKLCENPDTQLNVVRYAPADTRNPNDRWLSYIEILYKVLRKGALGIGITMVILIHLGNLSSLITVNSSTDLGNYDSVFKEQFLQLINSTFESATNSKPYLELVFNLLKILTNPRVLNFIIQHSLGPNLQCWIQKIFLDPSKASMNPRLAETAMILSRLLHCTRPILSIDKDRQREETALKHDTQGLNKSPLESHFKKPKFDILLPQSLNSKHNPTSYHTKTPLSTLSFFENMTRIVWTDCHSNFSAARCTFTTTVEPMKQQQDEPSPPPPTLQSAYCPDPSSLLPMLLLETLDKRQSSSSYCYRGIARRGIFN
jgi:hypothetical protein